MMKTIAVLLVFAAAAQGVPNDGPPAQRSTGSTQISARGGASQQPQTARQEMRVISAKFVLAQDLAGLIKERLGARAATVYVLADARANSLVVSGDAEAVAAVEELVSQLDTRPVSGSRRASGQAPDKNSGLVRDPASRDPNLARGVLEEELNQDLDAAIAAYRASIAEFEGRRVDAGHAIFRLAECYRKQGRLAEARSNYHRILREFSDLAQLAEASQKQLASSAEPGVPRTLGESVVRQRQRATPSALPGEGWQRGADSPLSARHVNTAVWTGKEMIVFGGESPGVSQGDGARYQPATDQWTMLPNESILGRGRNSHTAVWTGTEMIVWGGYGGRIGDEPQFYNTGARFNPASNTWTPVSDVGAPSPRFTHTAVWTGTEMIVWGGYANPAAAYRGAHTDDHLNDGGRYDPSKGHWRPVSQGNGPSKRYGHSAIWTGTEMIVWGGADANRVLNDGFSYDPQEDHWRPLPAENAPSPRFLHHAVWTGREMVVLGGWERDMRTPVEDAAAFNPTTGQWRKTAPTPPGTAYALAVWTGEDIIAWGGPQVMVTEVEAEKGSKTELIQDRSNGNQQQADSQQQVARRETRLSPRSPVFINTGARYRPGKDEWIPITTENAPPARGQAKWAAVWTGEAMLFFGGWNGGQYFNDTWLYRPPAAVKSTGTTRLDAR